ncbi:MAG: nucleotidyltransferase domain-containing protein [Acidobacteriota bacterium]|nr:nucleotidyltransferase domain-containing protein [Acidobacteriota bacterium]
MSVMNEKLKTILTELRRYLASLYGERLVEVMLFGSQARGDAVEGADIDGLVVLKGKVRQFEEVARTSEFNSALCLKYDVLTSRIFVSEDDYPQSQLPMLENARRDGVRISCQTWPILSQMIPFPRGENR